MVLVENVTVVPISTFEEIKSIIQRGSDQRHTSGTQMNEESSRSHLILSIVIESTNLQTQSVARGKVLLILMSLCNLIKSWICLNALDSPKKYVHLHLLVILHEIGRSLCVLLI